MDNQENNSFVHDELPEEVEIIGISFRGATKVYYFNANGCVAKDGDNAIVETARGLEYGKVTLTNAKVKREELVLPLKNVIRIADKNDDMRYEANRDREKDAFDVCVKKILDHKLDMKLIDVEYTFDNSKLLFYFTSDDRVDFRELVKDLAGYFRTRIELRQIGIRDEAKIMGGLGICGRPFCCNTFLPDFVQVSIKMAKEQNLSLNSAKISGACGRLMCCLRYEYDTYQEELRRMPKLDATVITPDGVGVVTELKPLQNIVKVLLSNENEKQPKQYHLSVLKPFDKNATVEEDKREEKAQDSVAVPDKKGNRNERHTHSGDKQKKNEPVKKDKNQEEKVAAADVSLTSEAKEEKRERDERRHGKHNRHGHSHNKDKTEKNVAREENTAPKAVTEENKEAKADSVQPERNGKNNHHGRHHHKKHGGEAKENRKEQQSDVKKESFVKEKKEVPFNKTQETDGRKSFAPMPSNSIKKGPRNRFGQIKTKPGSAFSPAQGQEKKDNSEKK